jgi:activator of HSP90 ATPase
MEFSLTEIFNASPEEMYTTWLSSNGHTKMTGAEAYINTTIGEKFSAWDGYISGKNLELEPGKRIVQSWRTTEFDPREEDSYLELQFAKEGEKTRLSLKHSNLSEEGIKYKQGWVDNYFIPMKKYFGSS